MKEHELRSIVAGVHYPGLSFRVTGGGPEVLFVQVEAEVNDSRTGQRGVHRGRKWYLSPHMTESEVVQTCFLAVKTWQEHEARELFTYQGRVVFNPHYNVNALLQLADQDELDVRP